MGSSMAVPQKTKNNGPAISLLGIKPKSGYNKDTYTSMFIAALFTVAKL
jgi:hypothetical protein